MPQATLTSKGQITIPAAVRHQYNLRAGDLIDFAPNGRSINMVPARKPGRFAKYRGVDTVKLGPGPNAVVEWVRSLRGE